MDWEIVSLIVILAGALAMMARALSRAAEANKAATENTIGMSQTVVALNNEIQEHSKERAQWNAERVRIETDAKTDRDALRAEMDEMKRGYETRLNNITTEHVRLQDQVTAERDARLANERESLQKIELLNTRIAELEKERAALIEKVDRLVAQLIQAEMDKAEQAETIDALEAQVTKLAASLNGKADKPGTGELKPETVAKAQEQAESEV